MTLKLSKVTIPAVIFCIFLWSCSDEEPKEEPYDPYETINIADSLEVDSGKAMVFLLPAPLQVATLLKGYEIPYSYDLISHSTEKQTLPTEFTAAVNLGIHTIDMGYAALYGDYQHALNISQSVDKLMGELKIESIITKSMRQRFEDNRDNKDSISRIILENYSYAHDVFRNNGREGVGLLILSGCFIEGLYLFINSEIPIRLNLQQMLVQQKEYARNIQQLLKFYSRNNKEVFWLLGELSEINQILSSIDIYYDEKHNKIKTNTAIPPSTLLQIKEKVKAIREKLRISVV